ncbi:SLC13 family permease [Modicisalibacter coralii]|uniref:SLC13 family permease n=1 Tax=Modicisalibacter coralii TaxID=2304602 RepID=UPI00100AD25C|nr:SLC13 family permease [Halomonas coralii]
MSAAALRSSRRHLVCLTGIVAVGAFLLLAPGAPTVARAASVVVLSIALWATGWLPQWLTALVFFTLCTVADVAPPDTVFAGFASAATWLVFAGLVIGAAIQYTGLGENVASRVGAWLTGSYRGAMAGVIALGVAMAFVMPSAMGRIVLLAPLLVTLADHLGYAKGRAGHTGLILGGMLSTVLPTYAILPANVPNNVLMGAAEAVLGEPPTYSAYLLLHFPVLGIIKALTLFGVMLKLYPDRDPQPGDLAGSASLSAPQRRLALVLCLAVALWVSDAWHGISPAWIGMLAALVCLFPGSGLMTDKPLKSLNVESLFYVAGIVSLGALANRSGLGDRLAHYLLDALPLGGAGDAATFGLLSALSMALGTVVTLPGIPAILTPLAPQIASITGWSPEAVTMTQVVGFSTVILPYQAPPLVVGLLSAGLRLRDSMRVLLIMAVLSVLIQWPLDYLWWQWLGWI